MLTGKGFFIWQIRFCENGDPNAIANLANKAGLSHVVIKIADGPSAYNIDMNTGVDLVPSVVAALRANEIGVWGWHYVYGRDPVEEAKIAIRRVKEFSLDGYVIDVEAPYKRGDKHEAAQIFMDQVRSGLSNIPIALSSYRYPTYHYKIPWQVFLDKCDFNMPQFYWVGAHNPREQLARCVGEFQAIEPYRPIIPTGAAFVEHGWEPYVEDIIEVFNAVKDTQLNAINFWEWMNCRKNLPDIWDVINDYDWDDGYIGTDFTQRYLSLINGRKLEQIMELYGEDAYLVTGDTTMHDLKTVREWYEKYLKSLLPGTKLERTGYNCTGDYCYLDWVAKREESEVVRGKDIFRLKNDKIVYHFKFQPTN
jgi:hypothetical protein